jgi:sulfur-oxidizing protein SoxY
MEQAMRAWIRTLAAAVLAAGLAPLTALAAEPAADPWPQLRTVLFADRPISEDAAAVIELETPVRAEDAAVVPIGIRAKVAQTPEKYIRKIYLVIDRNPSPVGVVFTLTPDSGRADIETRVRIEEYTDVRAIAEMNDGKLYMVKRYVKASGGCSAPAGKDLQEAMARMGKMKFRVDGDVKPGQPVLAQLMISHPNISGLAMDQVTRLYAPPHFVRKVDVTYGGRPIISAEVDFTISENPNFRFYFVPRGEGELKAEVVDTSDLRFQNSIVVKPGAGGGS